MSCSFGTRIRYFRTKKHYTQRQLGGLMGVSAQAVSKWENDIACPDIFLLYGLAQTLEVPLERLLDPRARQPEA